jgi:predicted flap endonuclease-1-like 5' DNA nuclease
MQPKMNIKENNMFEKAVTQTYNQNDATLEILVMLAGSFLLGCLLCWLIRSFKSRSTNNSINTEDNAMTVEAHSLSSLQKNEASEPTIGNTASKPRAVTAPSSTRSSYTTPRTDDLTKIDGITPKLQEQLKESGINSFTDLRDANKESLNLSTLLNTDSKIVDSWPHQASLAAKGDWKKLTEYQDFTQRNREAHASSSKKENTLSPNKDDLKKIEGIGPRIEEILNKQGIYTFETLRKTDRDTLKSYLTGADKRFSAHETESWPHQAGMAEKGQWEELKIYQEFIDEEDHMEQKEAPVVSLTTKRASLNSPFGNVTNITQVDDLKKIEGIGPSIEALLQQNGLSSFEIMKDTSLENLVKILGNAGPQFRMHDPKSWPEQAKIAFEGDWSKLSDFQDSLLQTKK